MTKLTYERVSFSVVNINHTYVDPKLRGTGIASKMMQKAILYFCKEGYLVLASCSYAHKWNDIHQSICEDILAENFEKTPIQCRIF